MNVVIRKATVKDVQLISNLSAKTFYDTYAKYNNPEDMKIYIDKSFNLHQIKNEILDLQATFFLAFADEEAAGYCKLKWNSKPGNSDEIKALEIARFYAEKKFIGQGIGKLLMKSCIDFAINQKAKLIWLDVWQKNARAIKFYENCGFEIVQDWLFTLGKDIQNDYIMEMTLD